jgi:hypothetical protein
MNYIRTVISTVGHVSCIGVLATTNLMVAGLEFSARTIVKMISTVTMAQIEQDSRTPHAERIRTFQDSSDLVVYRPNTGADGGTGPDQVTRQKRSKPQWLTRKRPIPTLTCWVTNRN